MSIFILIIIIILINVLFFTTSIKLEIENLNLVFPKENKNMINKQSKILLKIYVLRKIKIGQIDLKKIDFKSDKFKNRIDKLKQKEFAKEIKKSITRNIFQAIKKLDMKIEKIDLNILIGTEDAAITAISIGIISTLISNIIKINDFEVQKYKIFPIYDGRNILKIELDSIFSTNITNIIYIFKLLFKRRVKENGRSSYRRSYAYSNE